MVGAERTLSINTRVLYGTSLIGKTAVDVYYKLIFAVGEFYIYTFIRLSVLGVYQSSAIMLTIKQRCVAHRNFQIIFFTKRFVENCLKITSYPSNLLRLN